MKQVIVLSKFVLASVIFSSLSISNPPKVFSQGRCNDREITAGNFSRGTQWLTANSRLVFQDDGNLVLFGNSANVLWATRTENRADRLSVQRDGNVVLYKGNQAVWATNTDRNPGAFLALQCDGNLVVYDASSQRRAIWATNTDGGVRRTTNASNPSQENSKTVFCECVEYVRKKAFGEMRIGIKSAYQADPILGTKHGYSRLSEPEIGAIVVMGRSFPGANKDYGHIGFVDKIERTDGKVFLHVLGSNQGDKNNFTDAGCNNVNITRFKTPVNGRSDVSFWKKN